MLLQLNDTALQLNMATDVPEDAAATHTVPDTGWWVLYNANWKQEATLSKTIQWTLIQIHILLSTYS